MTYCLKRKNKKRFFSFQSMPNLNFAELISSTQADWQQERGSLVSHTGSIMDKQGKIFPFCLKSHRIKSLSE